MKNSSATRLAAAVVTLGLVLAAPAFAQSKHTENTVKLDEGTAPPQAKIADFAFLAGDWKGPGIDGGDAQEFWAAPAGGQMMGVFRQFTRDGKPRLYEFMMLTEVGDSVELRIKHFGPDSIGWEEKDKYLTFRLVKVEAGAAWFHGLTFRREGEALRIHLGLRRNNELKEVLFDLRR